MNDGITILGLKFKIGEIVCLNSGGHHMTVAEIGEGAVLCIWMAPDGDCKKGLFPACVLRLV